jgi:hypothetical protein
LKKEEGKYTRASKKSECLWEKIKKINNSINEDTLKDKPSRTSTGPMLRKTRSDDKPMQKTRNLKKEGEEY